jgi:cobaltochelatase CobS
MSNTAEKQEPQSVSEKITCQVCGEQVHVITSHIKKAHSDRVLAASASVASTLENPSNLSEEELAKTADFQRALVAQIESDYLEEFPMAQTMSTWAEEELQARRERKKQQAAKSASPAANEKGESVTETLEKKPLHKVFGLTRSRATRDSEGNELMITVMKAGHEFEYMVPRINPDYVWDIDLLKTIIMAVENKIPAYLWGYAGVGKSTGWEQYCASTNRPLIRVQHTGDTESPHIIGQTLANEKGTYFNPGPLALAMKHGFLYLADEYDFAFPQVTSVYQPVLENKALYIKEADDEWRMIEPHENFYMCATGNTNGAGDESGLFQGTNLQNAANFERYGIVRQVFYPEPKAETRILAKKFNIDKEHVKPVIDFVNYVRDAYDKGKITNTAGQRVSLYITQNWLLTGDYKKASELALTNRLPEACRKVVSDIADRCFK